MIPIAVERIRAFRGRAGRPRYGPTADRVGVVIERLRAYAGTGALGAYVPDVADAATIAPISLTRFEHAYEKYDRLHPTDRFHKSPTMRSIRSTLPQRKLQER